MVDIKNLEKLRDFLIANYYNINFEMGNYRTSAPENHGIERPTMETFQKPAHLCQTAGCAVGWAPFVVPPDITDHYLWKNTDDEPDQWELNYYEYSSAYLLDTRSEAWRYLFSGNWHSVDNTAIGAAYRLDEFIRYYKLSPGDAEKNAQNMESAILYRKNESTIAARVAYHAAKKLWMIDKNLD